MQNYKPLYLWSLEEAIRNNEKDLWRESYKENCDCARTIEKRLPMHITTRNHALPPVQNRLLSNTDLTE